MAEKMTNERRANPRVSAFGETGIDRARLRPGRAARIIDLSEGGALIETDCPLMPGLSIELQLGEPAAFVKVIGRILRCQVSMVHRDRIRYRGALAFEKRLPFRESQASLITNLD